MKRRHGMPASAKRAIAICTVGIALAACSDLTTDGANTVALSQAFQTVPAGFSANSNSFDPLGDEGLPFSPGMMGGQASFDRGNSGPGSASSGSHDGEHEDAEHEDEDHHDGFGRRLRCLLIGGG